jgi:hypothetical protein
MVTGAATGVGRRSQLAGVDQNRCSGRVVAAARQCWLSTAAIVSKVSVGGRHRPRSPRYVATGVSLLHRGLFR